LVLEPQNHASDRLYQQFDVTLVILKLTASLIVFPKILKQLFLTYCQNIVLHLDPKTNEGRFCGTHNPCFVAKLSDSNLRHSSDVQTQDQNAIHFHFFLAPFGLHASSTSLLTQ
jgi:hypothetical protein